MGIEPQDVKEERATAVEEYRSAQWVSHIKTINWYTFNILNNYQ